MSQLRDPHHTVPACSRLLRLLPACSRLLPPAALVSECTVPACSACLPVDVVAREERQAQRFWVGCIQLDGFEAA